MTAQPAVNGAGVQEAPAGLVLRALELIGEWTARLGRSAAPAFPDAGGAS